MYTLYDLRKDAIEKLRDWAKENPDETNAEEYICQFADQAVPVYTSDILAAAQHDLWLATTLPDAYTGKENAATQIGLNIYDYIYKELQDASREIEEGRKEAELDEEEVGYAFFAQRLRGHHGNS